MRRDTEQQPPGSHPYRARPLARPTGSDGAEPGGDAAILGGVAVVGAMPFVGLALGRAVESWELGVGAVGVLLAAWALADDMLDERARKGDPS